MEKQFKQVMRGAAVILELAVTSLLAITLKFAIYEPGIVNMVIQRIGG